MKRSMSFANIEEKFRAASKKDLTNIALATTGELCVQLSKVDTNLTFYALIIGARLGTFGDLMLTTGEKGLIEKVFKSYWQGDIEEIYSAISKPITDNDYEVVSRICALGKEISTPFLYYVMSFAYIDGIFEDEVASKLDIVYGIEAMGTAQPENGGIKQ